MRTSLVRRAVRPWLAAAGLVLALAAFGSPQRFPPDLPIPQPSPSDRTLPNGKSQQDEILKADYQQDLKDAAHLVALAEQLKKDLEKNDRNVLSVSSVRKTEEIEKLAKRIRIRLVR